MMTARWFPVGLVFASLVGLQGAALADPVAADALFEEGKRLLDAKDYERACPKFAASIALKPAVGATMYLGDCYEQAGKFASAWRAFSQAEAMATEQQDKRLDIARVRRVALEPQLAKVTLSVAPESTGVRVTRNDVQMDLAKLAKAAPTDPGSYVFRATADGMQPWEKTVVVKNGKIYALEVPALIPIPTTRPPGPKPETTVGNGAGAGLGAATLPAPHSGGPTGGDVADGGAGTGLVIAGAAIGGLGLVGLTVGIAMGASGKANVDDAAAGCNTSNPDDWTGCSDESAELLDDADGALTISTVGLVGGSVLLAGGITLLAIGLASGGDDDTTASLPVTFGATPLAGGGGYFSFGGQF